jgi:amino acid permease
MNMAPDELGLLTREALLGGLPARRASTLLFAIESRAAHLSAQAHQATAWYLTEKTEAERERAFLKALAQGRDLPVQPTIQNLERYAPQWADLLPAEPGIRAALARLLGQKYTFTYQDVPALRQALGLNEPAVQQAYQRLYGQPLDAIFAPTIAWRERLRWARARLGGWIEDLPPVWTVFALTLTETVGATVLALPIALAGVGPLVGVALLLVLGLANILTIVAISEVVTRNGNVRYGHAFFGRMVADYLGSAGSVILAPALLILLFLALMAYYVGVATTLASATGVRAEIWAALLFLVNLYVLRRQSLNATVASALLIGAVNIALILILSLLALPHVRAANLLYLNLPFVGGRPFDTSILTLIFGVIMAAYFGHISTGNCARLVLQRDPSGRSLIRGNIAALAVALLIYSVWVIAVNGAVAPSELASQSGTSLAPLAAVVGPIVYPFGLVYVVLGMGMASIHFALALFNQMREWLPAPSNPADRAAQASGLLARVRAVVLSRGGHFGLCIAPVAVIFLVIEWLLLTGQASFAGPLGFLGALAIPLLAGIFPMLMLAASRRKGELVPGLTFGFLGHPLVVVGVYLLFLVSIVLHGALIWRDPAQRLAALFVGVAVLGMTLLCLRRGMLAPRVVVELRVNLNAGGRATFSIISSGRPAPADVWLKYDDGEQHIAAASGEVPAFPSLQSATFQLPATSARELKVWAHTITPEGASGSLPARLTVYDGEERRAVDLGQSGGQVVLRLNHEQCRLEVAFPASSPVSQLLPLQEGVRV